MLFTFCVCKKKGLDRYFHMYADPDTGLINAEGFRSVLQCLRLCPSEAFVNRVFKDHDTDRKCEVTVIINLFCLVRTFCGFCNYQTSIVHLQTVQTEINTLKP